MDSFRLLKFEEDAIVLLYNDTYSVRVYPIQGRWLVVVRKAKEGQLLEALPLAKLTEIEGFVRLIVSYYSSKQSADAPTPPAEEA